MNWSALFAEFVGMFVKLCQNSAIQGFKSESDTIVEEVPKPEVFICTVGKLIIPKNLSHNQCE